MLDCVLIVVSYRSGQDVAGLLATVPAAVEYLSWEAVVVNNDVDDDLSGLTDTHPGVRLVDTGANLGYAGAINVGLATAPPSRFIVFLNPDVRFGPGALSRMVAEAGDRRAVVPMILDEDGGVQPSLRREPTIMRSLGDALFGDLWPDRPGWLSEMVRDPSSYALARTADWATGAALLVPSSVAAELGEWDADRFFLYSEETDYCRRLRAAGVEVRYVPDAVVGHRGGGSGTSTALRALLEVNRTRYFRKWHGVVASTVFAAVVALNSVLRCHRAANRAALLALLSPRARAALPGGTR